MTNQSRGFGFIEMADGTAARKAIAELDGATIDNRAVKVMEARPKEDKPARSSSPFRSSGGYNKNRY
jgi:RNA recognition motif-containing protein